MFEHQLRDEGMDETGLLTMPDMESESAPVRCVVKRDRVICGQCEAVQIRPPQEYPPAGELTDVPVQFKFVRRPEKMRTDALAAYVRLIQVAREESAEIPSQHLKLISGFRTYSKQAGLWHDRLRGEFGRLGCKPNPPDGFDNAMRRASSRVSKIPLERMRSDSWSNAFHEALRQLNVEPNCSANSLRTAVARARKWVAPPGRSKHHTGRAIDIQLGGGTSRQYARAQRRTAAFRWLVCNGKRFGFHPLPNEPWHWEFVPNSATELATPRHQKPSNIFNRYDPWKFIKKGASAIASNDRIWLLTYAIRTGDRREKGLTNMIFFRRHPDRKGDALRKGEPGFHTLANEWLNIRDTIVKPLLARLNTSRSKPAPIPLPTPRNSPAIPMPNHGLGSIPLFQGGRVVRNYRFTPDDRLWTARLIVGEAGGRNTAEDRAVIQCVVNRYAISYHRHYSTFTKFLRAFSTTLQPVLRNWRAAKAHMHSSAFRRLGGTYSKNPNVPRGQLIRHIKLQRRPWNQLPKTATILATQVMAGQMPNPGIGNADNFASTYIWFRREFKRRPTDAEWRAYTIRKGRSKGRWIGDVVGLDQKKNAFFLSHKAQRLPPDAIKVT